MSLLQNDIFLKALKGEPTERVPVWMMRQAGRFLPEFRALREKYSFLERCMTPELASEITLQPLRRLGIDAAIIFSDILVIPMAMGMKLSFPEGKGPHFETPVRNKKDIDRLIYPDIDKSLGFVMQAIKISQEKLNKAIPLIGFAGSPWTNLCYMVEGKGATDFNNVRQWAITYPELAESLLDKITTITIDYLKAQVKAGADALQIFDSWGGILSAKDYDRFSLPYLRRILDALREECPVILFARGRSDYLKQLSEANPAAISIDWMTDPQKARNEISSKVTIQGNLDPAILLCPIPIIKERTEIMLRTFGNFRYIAGLGHGVLPTTPPENAMAFIETVKKFRF